MATLATRRVAAARRTAGRIASQAGWTGPGPHGFIPRAQLAWLTGGDPPPAPWPAGESEAMGLPPFGRGVALLANAIAGTGWHAARWDPALGISVRLATQPNVVTDPDPMTTPWHYRWAAVEDLILYGNHFAGLGDPQSGVTDRPGWLAPIPADEVWLMTDPARPEWWAWAIGGQTFDRFSLFHVSAGNRSGEVLGRGVLAQYGAWLGGSVAAETHAGAYFAGGALPPAVLQSPDVLTPDQAAELKAKWREMTSTREPVVMPIGYTLTPVVSDAVSAQLVESRQWNAVSVAMMLGIPSYKLGLQGPSMTYQTVETADIDFVRDSVDRYGQPLSEAFSKWLMPNGTSVVWDYAARMRADQKTTADVLTTYTNAKVLTLDEARAALGRPPLEDPVPADEPVAPGPTQIVESVPEGGQTDAGTVD